MRDLAGRVRVLVPETTVDEHHPPAAREHHIRAAGKPVAVQTVSVTHGVHEAPHLKFGLHSFAANRAHVGATHFRTYAIQLASQSDCTESNYMALQITEFFGLAPLDLTAGKLISLNKSGQDDVVARRCPFVNSDCIKPNHGACSVRQVSEAKPVICCPNRMYAGDFKILREISVETFGTGAELVRPTDVTARIATGSMTGNEVAVFGRYWGQELPLPRPAGTVGAASRKYYVDWILAKLDSGGNLAELTAVEVQTVDTTGNYSDQAQAFFRGQTYRDRQGRDPGYSDAGMNWENVNKRILPQIIYKGHVLRRESKCTKGLYFVCPKQVFSRIRDRLGGNLHEYHPSTGTITFRSYELGPVVQTGRQRSLMLFDQFTTTVDQVAIAFTSPMHLPEQNVYEAAINAALDR